MSAPDDFQMVEVCERLVEQSRERAVELEMEIAVDFSYFPTTLAAI